MRSTAAVLCAFAVAVTFLPSFALAQTVDVETGRIFPGYISARVEAPDFENVVKVDADDGITMCATKSKGASTAVYYGPCLANVNYGSLNRAPPLGYVKQSIKGLMLIKNGPTAYLGGMAGSGSGSGIATTMPALRSTQRAMTTPGTAAGNTQAATISSGSRQIGPAVCNNGSNYVYASGVIPVGNATVALAAMGLESEVGPAGGDGNCTEDLQASIGTATYLVLNGEFESEFNKFPIAATDQSVDLRIAEPGNAQKFSKGTYKFAFFGGFYGADWETLDTQAYSHLVMRVELEQLGCDSDCSWGVVFTHGDDEAVTTLGSTGYVADARSMYIRAGRGGFALRTNFHFDRTYRYGNFTITSGNLEAHDEGEGDVVINVVKSSDDSIFVDFVIPFDELAETQSYFVYDPSVSGEDDSTATTTMMPMTTGNATGETSVVPTTAESTAGATGETSVAPATAESTAGATAESTAGATGQTSVTSTNSTVTSTNSTVTSTNSTVTSTTSTVTSTTSTVTSTTSTVTSTTSTAADTATTDCGAILCAAGSVSLSTFVATMAGAAAIVAGY